MKLQFPQVLPTREYTVVPGVKEEPLKIEFHGDFLSSIC
jgi:hypothetical protein